MSFEPHAPAFSMVNAQILAQASAVAYKEPDRCAAWAKASGFTGTFDFFDNHDTQGFVAESGDAIIVAFRGTQPNRPMDWFVDLKVTRGKWDHEIGGLITDGVKGLLHGDITEEHEKAFRERATNILKGGVEKIEDHNMEKNYLVRLKTKLPQA